MRTRQNGDRRSENATILKIDSTVALEIAPVAHAGVIAHPDIAREYEPRRLDDHCAMAQEGQLPEPLSPTSDPRIGASNRASHDSPREESFKAARCSS